MITCSNKDQFKHYPYWDRSWFIYFLYFGDAYYIGATNKLVRRIQAHECTINAILNGKKSKLEGHTFKIIEHIKNTGITEFKFIVYADCLDLFTSIVAEEAILGKYFMTDNCLNIRRLSIGLRSVKEI